MSPKRWSSSSFLFIILFFFLRKKTQNLSSSLSPRLWHRHFCPPVLDVHRVLYLGPILLSFTESEKTLPRNHLKLWTSRHLLRMCNFLSCKLILAKEVPWPSCLSLVINADLQTLQQLTHSSTWLYQLLQILFCWEKFTTVFQAVFQNPHPNSFVICCLCINLKRLPVRWVEFCLQLGRSIDNYVETRLCNKKLNTLTTDRNHKVFIASPRKNRRKSISKIVNLFPHTTVHQPLAG